MAARSGAFSKSRRASVCDSTSGVACCFLKGDIKVTTQVYIYEVPLVILFFAPGLLSNKYPVLSFPWQPAVELSQKAVEPQFVTQQVELPVAFSKVTSKSQHKCTFTKYP